ncbi:hypothetical protein [Leptolyngbya sp. O-77]|uniref:hypothetical protein n=1 Tax=Leptolyngbya sp. O-77 TaxID=1080068 RepID=UPI00074D4AED|nr:hypothetical protein [Leptolyngbya sp. O-77]BAU40284.1 hypothetical protein O77CONTIG1_00081 [Leptolyngbya sp. O-77]
MAMTPKEELIEAIEQSPDELVRALLELLRVMQRQQSPVEMTMPLQEETEPKAASRLHRKQGILVIETDKLDELDINTFISDVREERIQNQIGQFKS